MCRVDTTRPLVMSGTKTPPSLRVSTTMSMDSSVVLKGAAWLRSVQVMVGSGVPIEVQEMSTLPPSVTVTTSAPLLTLVLAPSTYMQGTNNQQLLLYPEQLVYLM